MDVEEKAAKLVAFIHSLPDFEIAQMMHQVYEHMGATITDAMLQAGVRYDTVVRPRVQRIRRIYPEATTTTSFLKLLQDVGASEVVNWTHEEKLNRVVGAATFFSREGIETETDLAIWLQDPSNVARLKQLRGVGNKTADYFKILVGMQTSAIDRQLLGFLALADIKTRNYAEPQEIIHRAADLMGIERARLDHSIWKYMSTGKGAGLRRNCLG